jgi:hypothetical protein
MILLKEFFFYFFFFFLSTGITFLEDALKNEGGQEGDVF